MAHQVAQRAAVVLSGRPLGTGLATS